MLQMSKWATGAPMIQWCERNGLDATKIPDRADAITLDVAGRTMTDPGTLVADVWVLLTEADLPYRGKPGERLRTDHEALEVLRRMPVDSYPPLNPEWVRLLAGDTPAGGSLPSTPEV